MIGKRQCKAKWGEEAEIPNKQPLLRANRSDQERLQDADWIKKGLKTKKLRPSVCIILKR